MFQVQQTLTSFQQGTPVAKCSAQLEDALGGHNKFRLGEGRHRCSAICSALIMMSNVAAAEGSSTVFSAKKDSNSCCPMLFLGASMQSANTYAGTEAMGRQLLMDGGAFGETAHGSVGIRSAIAAGLLPAALKGCWVS